MKNDKKKPPIKSKLHPRNQHREQYDFDVLVRSNPKLKRFVSLNKYGNVSIDFFDEHAVMELNRALLMHSYDIKYWQIPEGYLCPPIPGRADYIHYMADLLADDYQGKVPKGKKTKVLDIGVGANCVYPIIGCKEYGWQFVGSDIDPISVAAAQEVVNRNERLKDRIEIRLQKNSAKIFRGIISRGERFDLTICNPPFHASLKEAQASTSRKIKNLKGKKVQNPKSNFGGQHNEIWYKGGEQQFIKNMVWESKFFAGSCRWFSTLVSKESNLKAVYAFLKKAEVSQVKTIEMGQGNKVSRVVAWQFETRS